MESSVTGSSGFDRHSNRILPQSLLELTVRLYLRDTGVSPIAFPPCLRYVRINVCVPRKFSTRLPLVPGRLLGDVIRVDHWFGPDSPVQRLDVRLELPNHKGYNISLYRNTGTVHAWYSTPAVSEVQKLRWKYGDVAEGGVRPIVITEE